MADHDREYLIQTLCRQIMGMGSPDGSTPKATTGIQDAASATVSIEMRGMVSNLRRQIWIDAGAYTKRIVDEIEQQASEINLDQVIAKTVRDEMQRVLRDIEGLARKKAVAMITAAVEERMSKLPEYIAQRFANKAFDQAWKDLEKVPE